MPDRLHLADARTTTGADFARSLGLNVVRTPAERLSEWQAEVEHYADVIERGGDWAVPPPMLHAARMLVEGRKQQRQRRVA